MPDEPAPNLPLLDEPVREELTPDNFTPDNFTPDEFDAVAGDPGEEALADDELADDDVLDDDLLDDEFPDDELLAEDFTDGLETAELGARRLVAEEPDAEALDPELESALDADFPLGDGTADTSATVECPYCTSAVEIALDPGSGSAQDYIEDCEICCQPWHVAVRYGPEGDAEVWVEALEG